VCQTPHLFEIYPRALFFLRFVQRVWWVALDEECVSEGVVPTPQILGLITSGFTGNIAMGSRGAGSILLGCLAVVWD
jgi:hypothetical protein